VTDENDFKPKLGRMGGRGGGKHARRYLSSAVAAAVRSAEKGATKSRRSDGSRIGRGASTGGCSAAAIGTPDTVRAARW